MLRQFFRETITFTEDVRHGNTHHCFAFFFQIPPPKPPPPEMHFIPNPTNTEFICLLGLEECVSKILNEDKENSIQPVPFSCSQCGTDFTPTWKWDKGAKGIPITRYDLQLAYRRRSLRNSNCTLQTTIVWHCLMSLPSQNLWPKVNVLSNASELSIYIIIVLQ